MTVVRKKILHTGTPVWGQQRRPPVDRGPSRKRKTIDVLVIGAGISGALVADLCSEAGLSVLVADRRGPIQGSSSASTALLQSDIDVPLTHLAEKVGLKDAQRHYQRSKLAVRALAERVHHLGIECELTDRESLYLAGEVLDAKELAKECQARRRAGLESELLLRDQLKAFFGFDRSAALLGGGNCSANPVQLTAGILNVATQRGARLLAPLEVTKLHETTRGVTAATKQGQTLHARYAVYATGYELPFAISKRDHQLISTWAIATKPQKRALWPGECLIWEASDPYLYLRTTADGRIICGGADEDFEDEDARDALLETKTKYLEAKLHAMLPGADPRAAYRWTGTFGTTPTGTPCIGFLPRHERTLAVLGYGGNGFTFSMIAAQVIRGYITGQVDPDADLYRFR